MPELILDEPKKDPRLVLDEPADPRFGSGLRPDFPDLPGFELSEEHKERMQNSLYYTAQYGIPPGMAYDMEPELTKERGKLDLLSDIGKAIVESPENIKIGTIGLAASTMFAIKRRGMMLSGGGIFPDEMVKHQFEPIKPEKREKLVDWREKPRKEIPGMIRPTTKDWPTGTLAEAFGLITRLPSAAGTVLQEKQRKLADEQDRMLLQKAPVTKAMRKVTQSGTPSMAAAVGVALLTGDPIVALALLGEMEGGGSFQTQLEGGASIMKSNVIADLSEAAEIGGEMMVLPKVFKGVKEGFSLKDAFTTILENTVQEGITGFNQRFLEVFGLETTKGTEPQEAALKALNEGIGAIPENAWVGGASAGGAVVVRGGFDLAVSAKEAVTAEKPIAKAKKVVSAEKQPQPPTEQVVKPEKAEIETPSKPLKAVSSVPESKKVAPAQPAKATPQETGRAEGKEELVSRRKELYKLTSETTGEEQASLQKELTETIGKINQIALEEFDPEIGKLKQPWQITSSEIKVPGAIRTIPKDSEIAGGVRVAMPSARVKGEWQVSQVSVESTTGKAEPFTHVEFKTKEGALEYLRNVHKSEIKEALKQNKPVPTKVLEEYKSEKWAQEALAKPAPAKPGPEGGVETIIDLFNKDTRIQGDLERGLDYYRDKLEKLSDEELGQVLNWTRQPERTPWIGRFVRDEVAGVMRSRGLDPSRTIAEAIETEQIEKLPLFKKQPPAPQAKAEVIKTPSAVSEKITPISEPKTQAKKGEVVEQVPAEPGTKPLPVETDIDSDKELPSITSARNATIAEDRKSIGLDEVASATRKSWKTSLKNAEKKNLADNALRTASEVNKNPRAMTDEETAGMVIKAARLKNEHRGLMEKIKQVPGNDVAAIKSLSSEMETVESEFETLSDALKLSGTEMGRALASRKLTINQSYDLVSVAVRAKAAKGEALSAQERQRLAELTTKLDAATAKIEALQKQVDESTAQNAVKSRGIKRYSRMSLEQKDTELNSLVSEVNELIKEGCY